MDSLDELIDSTYKNINDIDYLNNENYNEYDNQLNTNNNNINEEDTYNDDITYEICNYCQSDNIYQQDGYHVCRNCGIHNSIVIDNTQEWRYYGSEDNKMSDPARCGMPTSDLFPNSSIGSIIYTQKWQSWDIQKMIKIHSWNSVAYKDTSLLNSFNNIMIVASNYGINGCIIEEAKYMFKKVFCFKSYKRAKKRAMEAASVQWACKMKEVPRDSTEMATMFNISIKDMRKGAKQFEELWNAIQIEEGKNDKSNVQLLNTPKKNIINKSSIDKSNKINLKTEDNVKENIIHSTDEGKFDFEYLIEGNDNNNDNNDDNDDNDDDNNDNNDNNNNNNNNTYTDEMYECNKNNSLYKPSDSIDYLHRTCSKLNLSDKIYKTSHKICNYIEEEDYLVKHIPLSRTAGCLYYTCMYYNINISKYDIANVCGVSEVTINKCYQKICKIKDDIRLVL
jgi:transcription initiation factor TFIIIB Brf1 subunit/transcription initiation factor TFIIB